MISEKDREMAYKLAEVIISFDEIIFPENKIKRIDIVLDKPFKNQFFLYNEGKNEHYDIFVPGLANFVKQSLRELVHLALIEKDINNLNREDCVSYIEQEYLASIAAHEVRHRIQNHYYCYLELFSSRNIKEIPSLSNLGKIITIFGHKEKEFDAKIIEYLMAKEFYLGNFSKDNIKRILMLTPKGFR